MKLFDLHCDTALELYYGNYDIRSAPLHISLERAAGYDTYTQVAAVWSEKKLDDNACFCQYEKTVSYFKSQGVKICGSGGQIPSRGASFFLSVEDARLLSGDISRLDKLCSDGVKIITPVWGGRTCIGGAFDTDEGLTAFGREAVFRMILLGIIPDISHASAETAADIFAIASGFPVIASHSNSYSVYPHPRNLTDREFSQIASSGGIVGISLAPQHLCSGKCTVESITAHILHYLCLDGGAKAVALGCDFDGIGSLPDGIENVSSLYVLSDALLRTGLSDGAVADIFYNNAYDFFKKFIK